MNEQQITQLVNSLINASNTKSQYSVGPTSSHAHNGIDSQRINTQDLVFTNFCVWGKASTNVSGVAIITNSHILTTSTILALGQQSSISPIYAVPSNGFATIFNGPLSGSVYYLIIF